MAVLTLNTLLGFIAVVLIGLLGARLYGERVGRTTATLAALFPGSFVFTFAYSEALMIALTSAVSAAAFLAALTLNVSDGIALTIVTAVVLVSPVLGGQRSVMRTAVVAYVTLALAIAVPVAGWVARALAPFHLAGSYTMFLIVPSERFGFVVQASDDGASWSDYELLGVPSRVDRAPRFFAPYHDYLSFRLWFAGFCPPAEDGWLATLQQHLLAAEPAVERLFTQVPFAGRRPAWVRLIWCRFRFAPPEQRARGTFWVREELAVRIPPRRAA